MRINDLFCGLSFQNKYNSKEITNVYYNFFYMFGRFPGDLNLVTVLLGEISKFIKMKDIIFPAALHQKFSRFPRR